MLLLCLTTCNQSPYTQLYRHTNFFLIYQLVSADLGRWRYCSSIRASLHYFKEATPNCIRTNFQLSIHVPIRVSQFLTQLLVLRANSYLWKSSTKSWTSKKSLAAERALIAKCRCYPKDPAVTDLSQGRSR